MAEIPKIVGQRLRAVATLAEHPDPNLLAAFVERALAKREQVEILQHLSQCTSCREIVSLSAAQPGIADVVPVIRVSPSWLSWPVLRWGAAVACVMVVGAAVMLHQRQESRPAGATANVQPAVQTQIPVPNSTLEKNAASLQSTGSEGKTAFLAKPAPGRQKVADQPTEMADARTTSPFADVVPGRAKEALGEQGAQADRSIGGSLAAKRTMAAVPASEAMVPENLIPRWTLSADGTLQRSLDSGRTWQTIPVSSQTMFRALAADGLDIWVGGAAGALFHSSDAGQHWTQVRPVANGEALTDDIIGVEFRDALHGRLTSSMEETWITADAGQTWQKQ
ncbi:MAG TPA: YCF48-related protein [Terriglobales bacterium]|nr:YCF48-related protein [Terriglobales bacterium]